MNNVYIYSLWLQYDISLMIPIQFSQTFQIRIQIRSLTMAINPILRAGSESLWKRCRLQSRLDPDPFHHGQQDPDPLSTARDLIRIKIRILICKTRSLPQKIFLIFEQKYLLMWVLENS